MPSALRCAALVAFATLGAAAAQADDLASRADALATELAPQLAAWRRDIHQHPELSNREVRTAKLVAAQLKKQGYELRTGVAHTGVIGVLRGGRPGPVVALRADMDALPVTEATGLPFASTARAVYEGHEVGVMHACGHDAHTAILLGVASVLAKLRPELPGTVVLVFQPAEEGAPQGERGGAQLMLEQGAFASPKPDAVFGLHVSPDVATGELGVRAGAMMASSDRLHIRVRGRQSHAATPWLGADPIAAASRIVLALEALPAREVDARVPSVVSIGAIHGGVRHNIIPAEVELLGTIRALDATVRSQLHEKLRRSVEGIASASGVAAEVEIAEGNPMVWNDPELFARMRPALERAVGTKGLVELPPWTASEDFAWYQQRVPGLFVRLGVREPAVAVADAAQLHTAEFRPDEAALPVGVRTLASLALAFLSQPQ